MPCWRQECRVPWARRRCLSRPDWRVVVITTWSGRVRPTRRRGTGALQAGWRASGKLGQDALFCGSLLIVFGVAHTYRERTRPRPARSLPIGRCWALHGGERARRGFRRSPNLR